ncbi:hypothetical protein GCM10023188_24930 [Pontibacter saemangeumensis]|uniref:SGNH/GDSL hydrolase family protein n=1 Tax=Pontibacter saemangeumensis TaxID=1084525 RepID=A0ABP8LQL1_9BACT
MKATHLYIFNSNKIRIIARVLLFNILLIVILKLIGYGLDNLINAKYALRHKAKIDGVMDHTLDSDIAIFGSSVAYTHFNPSIISSKVNKTCYNFGLDGTPLNEYKGILNEFLSYSTAEVIVLAGTYSELAERTQIYEFKKYEPYLGNENLYNALSDIDSELAWKSRYVPFYNLIQYNKDFYDILVETKFDFKLLDHNIADAKDYKGFHPVTIDWSNQKYDTIKVEISEKTIINYQEILRKANSKGIKVILVLSPIYIQGQRHIVNLNQIKDVYKNLAGEENIFMDFTQSDICNRKELFRNNTHLNAKGANIFSAEFSAKLNKADLIGS